MSMVSISTLEYYYILKLELLYIFMSPCTFAEMYENGKQDNRLRQRAFKDFLKPN